MNRGVTHLAEREAFVAFGLGDGGALLAAIAGNADKLCIGVHEHDAPQVAAAGPARDEFLRRFDELADGERHFIEPGFSRCLARLDERTIGVCFVSALSHEPIAERLAQCEPHLAENAYLLVDNCNCERTRQLTLDFVAASRNQYRVLADARTAEPGSITGSLTWGRGLLVLQLLGATPWCPARRGGARRRCWPRPPDAVVCPTRSVVSRVALAARPPVSSSTTQAYYHRPRRAA